MHINAKLITRTGDWEIKHMEINQDSYPWLAEGTWLNPETNLYDAYKYYANFSIWIPSSNSGYIAIYPTPLNTTTRIILTVQRILTGELAKIGLSLYSLFIITS